MAIHAECPERCREEPNTRDMLKKAEAEIPLEQVTGKFGIG